MTQLLVDRTTVDETGQGAEARPVTAATSDVRIAPVGPRARRSQPARRVRSRRPRQASGRRATPVLRPTGFWTAPSGLGRPGRGARSCSPPAPSVTVAAAAATAPTWRLTDRGVAVVLVIGLMMMVAALTVVGLTAMSVTGDGYQATVSAGLPR